MLSAIRPGGAENPERSAQAWLRYYGRLCALRALAERDTPAENSAAALLADRTILEALAGAARRVTLTGSVGGTTAHLEVHPKSAIALLRCHARDLEIARLLAYVEQLGASDDPDASTITERALTEALYQHRVLAWIACTPGPGLPFPELEADPALPAPFAELSPFDLVAIARAFEEVNWAQLRSLESLITPDPDAESTPRRRPAWSQFFASIASTEGRASEHVLRDRSLVGLVATVQLSASAQREAMAEAKEKARTARPDGDD